MDQIQSFFGQTPTNNEEEKKEDESQTGPQIPPLQQPGPQTPPLQQTPEETKEDDDEEDEEEESESDDDDYNDDFKKLEQDNKSNILLEYHPETQQISHEELMTLSVVTRNKYGQIIDPLHKTIPIMTRYEKAKILGIRAKQLNSGSKPYIKIPRDMINGITIANEELKKKKIPFIIRRPIPNGGSEYWDINDLEILD